MATMNISLPDALKAFAEEQVAKGRCSGTSDHVRDLIRREAERQRAIAESQALVDEGITSGPAAPFDGEAFLAGMELKHGA